MTTLALYSVSVCLPPPFPPSNHALTCPLQRLILLLPLALSATASPKVTGSTLVPRADWPEYTLTMYSPSDTTCAAPSSFTYPLRSYWNCVAGPYYSSDPTTLNLGNLTHFTVKNETAIPAGCKCQIRVHTDFICDGPVTQTFELSGAQSCVAVPTATACAAGIATGVKHVKAANAKVNPAVVGSPKGNPAIVETCSQKCYTISSPDGNPVWPSEDCARVGVCGSIEYVCTGC